MSKYHFNVYRIIVYVFVQFPDYPIRSVIRRILNFLYVNSQFFKGHYTEINLGGGEFYFPRPLELLRDGGKIWTIN